MKVPLCLVTTIALIASAAALVAAAADNEASRIFTAENAQQVLGGPVVPAARNSTADIKNGATIVSQCSYSANTGDPAPSVSLTLRRAASADETKSIFLSSKKIYEGKDVTDLGDQAYRTTAPAQLNVLKGKNWLIITAGAFPAADIALQEKAAREILKNLHD